jgi:CRP-like cAMP-binding protein
MAKNKKAAIAVEKDSNLLLFKYCSEEWHPLIEHYLRIESFSKNDPIIKVGQPVKGIKFIKTGMVKVDIEEESKEKIIRIAAEGEILGHRGIGAESYSISAHALVDTEIYFIPKEIFTSLLKSNPELALWLINFLAKELRRAESETRNLVHLSVKQRIASALLYTAKVFGYSETQKGKLRFTLSRKDFASMVGTTYESVIRTITELQEEKLIDTKGKEIIIKSEKGLRGLLVD